MKRLNPLSYPHPRQPTVRFQSQRKRTVKHENPKKFKAFDGKRFVVHADELLTAFLELESVIRSV
jgi:hypothetical protein